PEAGPPRGQEPGPPQAPRGGAAPPPGRVGPRARAGGPPAAGRRPHRPQRPDLRRGRRGPCPELTVPCPGHGPPPALRVHGARRPEPRLLPGLRDAQGADRAHPGEGLPPGPGAPLGIPHPRGVEPPGAEREAPEARRGAGVSALPLVEELPASLDAWDAFLR